jgi:chromosome partitioning protein
MKVVALSSIKGGVGKTTAAVNLAHLAADAGHRTLLWDLDPQGAATYTLALPMAATTMQSVNRKRERAQLAVLNSGGATIGVLEWGIEGLVGVGS